MNAYGSGQFNLGQLDMIIIEHHFFYITKDELNLTWEKKKREKPTQLRKEVTTSFQEEGGLPSGAGHRGGGHRGASSNLSSVGTDHWASQPWSHSLPQGQDCKVAHLVSSKLAKSLLFRRVSW